MWFQLFQLTCSIFELLRELNFDHFFGIVAYTSWQDNIPSKQQWQGLTCFTSGYHSESSSSSKVWYMYLCTLIALSGHCTGKHHVWKHRMWQTMITKVTIICSKSSWQQRVEHSSNLSLNCSLDNLLAFILGSPPSLSQDCRLYWQFYDCANQCYADLNLGWQWRCKTIIIHDINRFICQ